MRRLPVCALLLVLPAMAWADDTVTVRGARQAGVSTAQEGQQPRESTDLASLIAPLPGVYVRRQGAEDSLSTLSIRGTSPQQAAVYVAGVPVTGGGDPAMDLSLLPVWPGMRTKVYRTFAPASLGRPSLGGALSLEAPSLAGAGTEVFAGVGSYGAARFRVGERARLANTQIAAAVFGSRADQGFDYLDPVASSADKPVYRTRENAGHAALGALLSSATPVALPFSQEPATLSVTGYAQARRQGIAGSVRLPTPFQTLHSLRTLSSVDLSVPSGHGAVHVQLYQRYDTLSLRDQPAAARLTASPVRADDAFFTLGGKLGGTQRQALGAHGHLDVGLHVDAMREQYWPGAREQAAAGDDAGRSSVGGALEVHTALYRRVQAGAHARLDGWHDLTAADSARLQLLPTGHFDVDVQLARGVHWVGRVGRTARVPSFLERFGNQGFFIGDPQLRPESAWTQDAGLRGQIGAHKRTLSGEVTVFHTEARDLIQFVPQGAFGRAKAQNLGLAELVGLETLLEGRYALWDERRGLAAPTLVLRAVYNLLLSQNQTLCLASAVAQGRCEAPPLPGRPRHALVGDVGVDVGRYSLRYGLDAISGMNADLVGVVPVPARVLQSAGARVRLPYGLEAGLDARNLADVRTGSYPGAYSATVRAPIGDQFDYPLPGRTFLLFARLRH